jgi:radical SAM superfamily enzyme YgiQ (UPF0313 family)
MEIKRVLLIDPHGYGSGLNLGLGYISAVLAKNGYEVKVVDCNNMPQRLSEGPKIKFKQEEPEDWKLRVNRGIEFKPDVVGVSINSFTQESAYEIAAYCRGVLGNKAIYLAGGPHVTVFKKEFMEKNHHLFDFAVVGEGEETIIDLLNNLETPQAVKGIMFYDQAQGLIVQTPERTPISNLDALPFPNLESFDSVQEAGNLINYQMSSSRGCPYKCVFCSQILSRYWRARSPENVISEIKSAQQKFGIKSITFWDDNFTLNIERAKKICDLLISENLNLTFGLAGVRADRLDEELLQKLKRAGCVSIFIGIEDGDEETFKYVGKGETLEQIRTAVSLIKKYGIELSSYMVVGLVNSTYDSFLRSLKFVESLGISAHWNIAFPIPHTGLYDWAKINGRFLTTVEEGFKQCMTSKNPPVVFDTPDYPKEQRLKAFYVGNLRCRSYEMLLSSRRGGLISQALDILEVAFKYDREKFFWHFSNLFSMFFKSLINLGKIK